MCCGTKTPGPSSAMDVVCLSGCKRDASHFVTAFACLNAGRTEPSKIPHLLAAATAKKQKNRKDSKICILNHSTAQCSPTQRKTSCQVSKIKIVTPSCRVHLNMLLTNAVFHSPAICSAIFRTITIYQVHVS